MKAKNTSYRGDTPVWAACTLMLTATLLAASACDKSGSSSPQASAAGPGSVQSASIEANDQGFVPNEVSFKKGQKAMLTFKRTSKDTCADKVVFPELEIEKPLPVGEKVQIEIPTHEARTLIFQCGMGMYKSKVVIE